MGQPKLVTLSDENHAFLLKNKIYTASGILNQAVDELREKERKE